MDLLEPLIELLFGRPKRGPESEAEPGRPRAEKVADPNYQFRTDFSQFVVVDVETTGLSHRKDRIVELAIVGLTVEGEIDWTWSSLFNPEKPMPDAAFGVHGIRDDEVVSAPRFAEKVEEVDALLKDKLLVGHNLKKFDIKFLQAEFKRCRKKLPTRYALDTLEMSRRLDHGERTHSLLSACLRYGIIPDEVHRAAGDARATATLFLRMHDRHADRFNRGYGPVVLE